jgi:Protein of unknown function (DUF2283)
MRVTYDRETDTMTISLRDERIKESDEVRPGVIADFGYDGGSSALRFLTPPRWSRTPAKCSFTWTSKQAGSDKPLND